MQSSKRWLVFNVDVACCAECCQLPYLDSGFLLVHYLDLMPAVRVIFYGVVLP